MVKYVIFNNGIFVAYSIATYYKVEYQSNTEPRKTLVGYGVFILSILGESLYLIDTVYENEGLLQKCIVSIT